MRDDFPTFGYPMMPTVSVWCGRDRAYCFSKRRRAGAPRDAAVDGSGASPEFEAESVGTCAWERLDRCD